MLNGGAMIGLDGSRRFRSEAVELVTKGVCVRIARRVRSDQVPAALVEMSGGMGAKPMRGAGNENYRC